jgi:hypothetical protein
MHDQDPREEPDLTSTSSFRVYLRLLERACMAAALLALIILGLRACLRLNFEWDSARYNILFAARRGGIPMSYGMDPELAHIYEGFPPLADVVQGVLWRCTGSINAAGAANYLAFVLFLFFCHRMLSAPFGIVAVVALTAPLVIIHTATCYVDLFGNCFLATSALALAAMLLFDRQDERPLLFAGLAGLIAATWTKYVLLAPGVALLFAYLVVFGIMRRDRTGVLIVAVACMLAAAPYLKNYFCYGNPFWPLDAPLVGRYFRSYINMQEAQRVERPPVSLNSSQMELFWRSLFEVDNPYSYPNRPRWTLDQGSTWESHRLGGFWYGSVILSSIAVCITAVAHNWRRAAGLIAAGGATLVLISVLPQSHELRYYLFIPLCWAGLIGMLLTRVRRSHIRLATLTLLALFGGFLYMVKENQLHYAIERVGWPELADQWLVKDWWQMLKKGTTYWAVGMRPRAIFLTGPDQNTFEILDRNDVVTCPDSATLLHDGHLVLPERPQSVAYLMKLGTHALYQGNDSHQAELIFRKVLRWNPTHYGATYQLAMALDAQARHKESRPIWRTVLEMSRKLKDQSTETIARDRISKQVIP